MDDRLLTLASTAPDAELIQHLEQLLAEARAGKLRAIFAVTFWARGAVAEGWCNNSGVATISVVGQLEILKAKLIARDVREELSG